MTATSCLAVLLYRRGNKALPEEASHSSGKQRWGDARRVLRCHVALTGEMWRIVAHTMRRQSSSILLDDDVIVDPFLVTNYRRLNANTEGILGIPCACLPTASGFPQTKPPPGLCIYDSTHRAAFCSTFETTMNKLSPVFRPAARQLPLRTTGRRRPPSSTALLSTSHPLYAADEFRQAQPRGPYYDMLLTNPPPYADVKSEGPPSTARPAAVAKEAEVAPTSKQAPMPAPAAPAAAPASAPAATPFKVQPAPATQAENIMKEERRRKASEKARIIFGSRLAGPAERAERLAEIRNRSKMIAGVMVPPKPDEPENCCMSGCVDCVWDRYRDEMEGWAQANAEASRRLKAQEAGVAAGVSGKVPPTAGSQQQQQPSAVSMDDDGGGSSSHWEAGKGDQEFFNDELYKSLPVGIREFMKQEKRIKLKHMQEGTAGG